MEIQHETPGQSGVLPCCHGHASLWGHPVRKNNIYFKTTFKVKVGILHRVQLLGKYLLITGALKTF